MYFYVFFMLKKVHTSRELSLFNQRRREGLVGTYIENLRIIYESAGRY
jgi:hypothetical protein